MKTYDMMMSVRLCREYDLAERMEMNIHNWLWMIYRVRNVCLTQVILSFSSGFPFSLYLSISLSSSAFANGVNSLNWKSVEWPTQCYSRCHRCHQRQLKWKRNFIRRVRVHFIVHFSLYPPLPFPSLCTSTSPRRSASGDESIQVPLEWCTQQKMPLLAASECSEIEYLYLCW